MFRCAERKSPAINQADARWDREVAIMRDKQRGWYSIYNQYLLHCMYCPYSILYTHRDDGDISITAGVHGGLLGSGH
jgi:hypothetical protein